MNLGLARTIMSRCNPSEGAIVSEVVTARCVVNKNRRRSIGTPIEGVDPVEAEGRRGNQRYECGQESTHRTLSARGIARPRTPTSRSRIEGNIDPRIAANIGVEAAA